MFGHVCGVGSLWRSRYAAFGVGCPEDSGQRVLL